MSERKKKILASVVEQYIKTGEPVGSNVLLKSLDFSVSSATVRNEMSELSEMGFLEQTHTSSGRVPTHKGYRYYVDELMSERSIDDEQRRRIDMMAGVHFNDPEKLLEAAGEILADITKCAVVSTTPSDSSAKIKKIELIPIARRTAIVVLLTSGGVLKNRVCRTDVELTPEIVETFYRLSAENFVGKTVADIQTAMIQSLVVSFGENSLLLSPIIITVADLAKDVARSDVMLEGQTNLLKSNPAQNTYEILDLLKRSEIVNELMSSGKGRINMYIGGENPFSQLSNSSIIVSRYDVDGVNSGAFGIVGSTRMDYASVLPSIKYMTDIVSDILKRTLED